MIVIRGTKMNNSIEIAHSIISKIVTKFCSLPPFMENKLVLLCQHCCWKRRHFRALFGLSDIGRLQGSRKICLQHDSLTFAMMTPKKLTNDQKR